MLDWTSITIKFGKDFLSIHILVPSKYQMGCNFKAYLTCMRKQASWLFGMTVGALVIPFGLRWCAIEQLRGNLILWDLRVQISLSSVLSESKVLPYRTQLTTKRQPIQVQRFYTTRNVGRVDDWQFVHPVPQVHCAHEVLCILYNVHIESATCRICQERNIQQFSMTIHQILQKQHGHQIATDH